jgi:hypothetical protein
MVKSRSKPAPFAAACIGSAAAAIAGALSLSSMALADDASPAAAPTATAANTADSAPAAGSWQSHRYSFQFLGFTTTYSCDGLADKLKKLLIAAGARADVKSQPGACASGFGRPDKFARADLTFYTLAPTDTHAAATDKTVGVWRSVTLTDRSPRDLGVGDCELVEQFRSQVLPMFTTRDVVNNTTCVPHQNSGSNIDLKFDSFAALPKKPAAGTAGS